LARELGVSERHLRRVLEREIGVSPIELAQTHRLLLAKQLLADTKLPITRIAYASGFQSLRRFNFTFRERYRMSPSALRRARRMNMSSVHSGAASPDLVRLTLAYRAPLAWGALIAQLHGEALPGVEVVDCACYRRTVRIDGCDGVVFVSDAAANVHASQRSGRNHLNVDVTPSLLPVLMPLLARLRAFFDLDAEPAAIDAHLAQGGLTSLVCERPGLRVPGTLEEFDVVLRSVIGTAVRSRAQANHVVRRVVETLADPVDAGFCGLTRLAPTAGHVADAGAAQLAALGVPKQRAQTLVAVSRAIADHQLCLEPGGDVEETRRALMHVADVGDRVATTIVMRSMRWPDALPVTDRALQRSVGASNPAALRAVAECWRPWRAYAAQHLWLRHKGGLA
jgi:AraC family transcriptional regulator of adaptative response / DNA-3-methyladenine glycosylase II